MSFSTSESLTAEFPCSSLEENDQKDPSFCRDSTASHFVPSPFTPSLCNKSATVLNGSLDLSGLNISSINYVYVDQYASADTVSIANNRISSFNAKLFRVCRKLDCANNIISRTTFLRPLAAHLTHLNLSYNNIVSLDGLEECRCLEVLNLQANKLKELPELHLTLLKELDVSSNSIVSLPDLSISTALKSLNFSKNNIDDFSHCSDRIPQSLQSLDIGENNLTDVSQFLFLRNLSSLVSLRIGSQPGIPSDVDHLIRSLFLCLIPDLKTIDESAITDDEKFLGESLMIDGRLLSERKRQFVVGSGSAAHEYVLEYLASMAARSPAPGRSTCSSVLQTTLPSSNLQSDYEKENIKPMHFQRIEECLHSSKKNLRAVESTITPRSRRPVVEWVRRSLSPSIRSTIDNLTEDPNDSSESVRSEISSTTVVLSSYMDDDCEEELDVNTKESVNSGRHGTHDVLYKPIPLPRTKSSTSAYIERFSPQPHPVVVNEGDGDYHPSQSSDINIQFKPISKSRQISCDMCLQPLIERITKLENALGKANLENEEIKMELDRQSLAIEELVLFIKDEIRIRDAKVNGLLPVPTNMKISSVTKDVVDFQWDLKLIEGYSVVIDGEYNYSIIGHGNCLRVKDLTPGVHKLDLKVLTLDGTVTPATSFEFIVPEQSGHAYFF